MVFSSKFATSDVDMWSPLQLDGQKSHVGVSQKPKGPSIAFVQMGRIPITEPIGLMEDISHRFVSARAEPQAAITLRRGRDI